MNGICIAVTNQKGGVGKTTTTANLGSALAVIHISEPVLVIDLDPQFSLTDSFAMVPDDPSYNGMDVCKLFESDIDPLSCCFEVETVTKKVKDANLYIVPSSQKLAVVQRNTYNNPNALETFKKNIEILRKYFSYIVIDCPPSLDILLTAAIYSCQRVVIPVKAENQSIQALNLILPTIKSIKEGEPGFPGNKNLKIEGLVITMKRNTKEQNDYEAELRKTYNILGVIPLSASVTNCACKSGGGLSCVIAHPGAKPSTVYRNIGLAL